jgi:hypothetical protein
MLGQQSPTIFLLVLQKLTIHLFTSHLSSWQYSVTTKYKDGGSFIPVYETETSSYRWSRNKKSLYATYTLTNKVYMRSIYK